MCKIRLIRFGSKTNRDLNRINEPILTKQPKGTKSPTGGNKLTLLSYFQSPLKIKPIGFVFCVCRLSESNKKKKKNLRLKSKSIFTHQLMNTVTGCRS